MLRDGSGYLYNGGFLERVGSDHPPGNLAGDGDEGDAVQHCVGETAHQVGRAGAGGGYADTGEARGPRVALGGEDTALLVAGKHVADGWRACQSLVDLQGSAAGVGEHVRHAFPLQSLHQDVGAFAWLIGGEARGEGLDGGGGGRLCCSGGGGFGEGA